MVHISKRVNFTVLGFLGLFVSYATRVNLSIAIVAMVNTNEQPLRNTTHKSYDECPYHNVLRNETKPGDKKHLLGEKYNWDPKVQGFILSSFYYSYVFTQIPGGILVNKVGAKALFGGTICLSCILYLFIPLAATLGAQYIIGIRIIQGFIEGPTFPAITYAVSNWAPLHERARMASFVGMGMPLANLFALPIAGVLCSSPLLGGWSSTFYVFGFLGFLWFVFWCFFMYETPDDHPNISKEELAYIEEHQDQKSQKDNVVPWRDILTSLPMWAVGVSHFGHNFAFLMFLTYLPKYFSTVLHFDLQTNGTLSALPYILQAASAFFASYIADKLRASNILDITTIRKICNSIGLILPAMCLLAIIYSGCHSIQIVSIFCLAYALNGFSFAGYRSTHVDMSPAFSGITFGISNTISNASGILSPIIVGYITYTGETMANWSIVFYITIIIYITCALFYAVFASAELQPWGEDQKKLKDTSQPNTIYCIENDINR